jgi:polyferredoxin
MPAKTKTCPRRKGCTGCRRCCRTYDRTTSNSNRENIARTTSKYGASAPGTPYLYLPCLCLTAIVAGGKAARQAALRLLRPSDPEHARIHRAPWKQNADRKMARLRGERLKAA